MDKETEVLLAAMQAAGAAIVKFQKTKLTIMRKWNNDILTQADLTANQILRNHLVTAFPSDGWLSEENRDDQSRMNATRVWVVDPIDGTIEFTKGLAEYAISVALIEKGEPILAAVFNPATNELFHAIKNQGAWQGEQRIFCTATKENNYLFLASRTEYQRGIWKGYEQSHRVKPVGSIAYKLALVAAGKADATFSLGPKSEWDIAAGVLLVQEAGGIVTDKNRNKFIFNQANVRVTGIVATASNINDQVFALIKTVT